MHVCALVIAGSALVQNAQPMTPAPPADLLSGPSVASAKAAKPTLVRRAFDGALEDIGPDAEYAALGLLDLSPSQRAQCDQIHAERMSVFDRCLRTNYGVIAELTALQGETDAQKWTAVMTKVRTAFEPYILRGGFLEEMRPHLRAEQVTQAEAMLAEYRQARTADLRKHMGDDARPAQIAVRARLEAFGKMTKESIERQVALERENFQILSDELGLTLEQQGKAQAIFQPLAVKRLQNIDVAPTERAKAMASFSNILTPQQRRQLTAYVLRQWSAASKAPDQSKTQTPPDGAKSPAP